MKNEPAQDIQHIPKKQKFKTIEELLERSRPNDTYYTLLVLSSIIIASGILINNIPIIVGGMLVTPLLTPLLVIALGFSTGQVKLVHSTSLLIIRSAFAIVIGSAILGILFGHDVTFPDFLNTTNAAFLYFIVALSSGIAVTFAWIRQEVSEILPGIAIAVSIVPPLSYIGIGLSRGIFEIAGFYLVVFILNLLGILMGSLIVFSISKFNKEEAAVEAKQDELEKSNV